MTVTLNNDGPLLQPHETMLVDDSSDLPEVYIIHTPEDQIEASWVKHRLERFSTVKMDIYTSHELKCAFTDIDLLKTFLEERCGKGAVCMFYVSEHSEHNEMFNVVKDQILYYSIFHGNRCVTPIWDTDDARKCAPYGLAAYAGVSVQSPRLVQAIDKMFEKSQTKLKV